MVFIAGRNRYGCIVYCILRDGLVENQTRKNIWSEGNFCFWMWSFKKKSLLRLVTNLKYWFYRRGASRIIFSLDERLNYTAENKLNKIVLSQFMKIFIGNNEKTSSYRLLASVVVISLELVFLKTIFAASLESGSISLAFSIERSREWLSCSEF